MVRMLRIVDRSAPEGHHRIADVLVHRAVVGVDHLGHRGEEAVQVVAQQLRVHVLRHPREAPDVGEQDRQFLVATLERDVVRILRHALDQLRRDVLAEQADHRTPRAAFGDIARHQVGRRDHDQREHARGERNHPAQVGIGDRIPGEHRRETDHRRGRDAEHAGVRHRECRRPAHQRDRERGDRLRLGGLRADRALERTRDQRGVDLHARVDLAHRGRTQVGQARRRGADQHDPVAEEPRLDPAVEHVGRRHVAKARGRCAAPPLERHQRGRAFGDRHTRLLAARTEAQAVGMQAVRTQRQRRVAEVDAQHRHRERLVELPLVVGQQRQRAHHAIAVDHRIEEAGAACRALQRHHVGPVAVPGRDRQVALAEHRRGPHRRRQHAGGHRPQLAREVVAQRHRGAGQRPHQRRILLRMRLGEHHVEADRARAALAGDGRGELRERLA